MALMDNSDLNGTSFFSFYAEADEATDERGNPAPGWYALITEDTEPTGEEYGPFETEEDADVAGRLALARGAA